MKGSFHDGKVGEIAGIVHLASIGHSFQTASRALLPWLPFGTKGGLLDLQGGGMLELDNSADEGKVQTAH